MGVKINRRGEAAGGRQKWRWTGNAALATVVIAAAVEIDPARVGLSTTPVVLHALSFRGPMAVALSSAGAAGLLSTGPAKATGSVPWRRFTVGAALLAAGLGQAAIVVTRGWAKPPRQGRADLVVVSLNTLGGATTPEQIASLVTAEMANSEAGVVALPETPDGLARECAALLAAAGHPFQVFSESVDSSNPLTTTSLLISEQLGSYRRLPAPALLLGAVVAEPVNGSGPTLAAVHPGAPMPDVGLSRWRSDVTAAVELSRGTPNSIVAGDFNACTDHQMMRDLRPGVDAATSAGRGAEGTWPAHFPAALAAPIDHVLVNGEFSVLGTRTVRVGNSDHRAVIARLASGGP